ncbi:MULTISPECIES: hypothetical protein [Tessaracoccus]|uniref:hypothetical protein n=1 Tax=Tessaracoccus TaxID=72763 RepID=UPI00099C9F75|nr:MULTISPECIES: hypothetical protein [Tessaracoccus]AQX14968.1 hypothetical protein BKM78_02760 [Tessaracoccus sp. T2.5-30]VEP39138.1 hypothetical protein TLA_TLA_00561 [Tessaracoccus lapidicaptus]
MEDEDWLMLSPNPADVWGSSSEVLNREVIQLAEEGRLDARDIDVALSLATFVHDEYEEYGTRGHNKLDDKDIALAQRALAVVLARVGIQFSLPWRDFSKFRSYWLKNAGYNSWQARRIILAGFFDPVYKSLETMLEGGTGGVAEAVSPHAVTGWPRVDVEVAALRERFGTARTAQDYRDVGNRCVAVLEAVGEVVYDQEKHLREGEELPARDKSKQRLERYVEDSLAGKEKAKVRSVVRPVIELAHSVKHQTEPTRRDSGIAADATVLLVNILRRAEQDF